MEPSTTNNLETITKGRWQWKSNPDPWSKTEESKWEPYPLEHSYLIEKAYYDQQKEVDLGDYLVYPLDLIQRKKGNLKAQRPIRRVNWMNDEEISDRSSRYFETEIPKTINKIFGSLGDFLSFFARRNPEILGFTDQFKEFERLKDLKILNENIIPKLVECFEEGLLKPNLEQLQDPSLSAFRKKVLLRINEGIQDLILLFQRDFQDVEEFYGQVLKAYTMDTDLYPSLIRYLRNESWHEVDKLLPYAFCLCKAFFNLKLKKNLAEDDHREEQKTSSPAILYRGTAFDELAISTYNKETAEYFSWNAVTSTSTNKNVAEEFMYKSVDLGNRKYPVMFIIEVPRGTGTNEAEYLKWIDIHQYSAIPKEDEVVLAPGSVFELLEVSTDQDRKTTMRIRLRDDIKSLAYGGMMMQGALQSHLMTEKEAKIVCFEGEELYQALRSLRGNTLIEEVEFSLCMFDRKSAELLLEILPTIKKAKTLKLLSCMSQDNEQIVVEKPNEIVKCEISKIEILGADQLFQLVCNKELNQEYWASVKELNLHFNYPENQEVKSLVSQGAEYLSQLKSLNIKFEEDNVNPGEILQDDRDLRFHRKSVSKAGNDDKALYDRMRSNRGEDRSCINVINLALTIQEISSKAHFLTCLILDFDFKNITDEDIQNLASQALKNLVSLTFLELKFMRCKQITDEGIHSLASQGLGHLAHLKSLGLFFNLCKGITSQGLESLAIHGLQNLTQLTCFKLNLMECSQITDEGIESLAFYGLKNLRQLKELWMVFNGCEQITDKGIESLASQGLRHLVQLTALSLYCFNITDKGLNNLVLHGIKNLSQLTSIKLHFPYSAGLSNFSIHNLVKVLHYFGYERKS